MMFHQFGLDTMIPPTARYALMGCLTCLPVLLLCVFFWFFPDEPEQNIDPQVIENIKAARVAEA